MCYRRAQPIWQRHKASTAEDLMRSLIAKSPLWRVVQNQGEIATLAMRENLVTIWFRPDLSFRRGAAMHFSHGPRDSDTNEHRRYTRSAKEVEEAGF
jgi:hypothetical protein